MSDNSELLGGKNGVSIPIIGKKNYGRLHSILISRNMNHYVCTVSSPGVV